MQGKVIIFSAPSGAGKTTIVRHLVKTVSNLEFSISATTREPRRNEKNGEDYYFLSRNDFLRRVESNEILEWEEVYSGVLYGTLASEIERIWSQGNHIVFDVDVKGGVKIKEKFGRNGLCIFVKVEDVDVLKRRLKKRNSESEKSLNERVEKAIFEMKAEGNFDRIIINHDLKQALKQAEKIVTEFLE